MELYVYKPDEEKEKKKYRHKRCQEDIVKRFKKLTKHTGVFYNLENNKPHAERLALIKILVEKKVFTYAEFDDFFFIAMDQIVSNTEKIQDEIRDERFKKGIIVPGKTIRS